jgi:pimeloyl-ACP methyl ester carboxylesterase
MIDDDLAYVAPWGFDPGQVSPPVLFLHGGQDRIAPSAHARWLAHHVRSGELRMRPDDGHISILSSAAAALDWLRGKAT